MDRIRREYKVEAELGPLMISYRESVALKFHDTFILERTISQRSMRVILELTLIPNESQDDLLPGEKPRLKFNLKDKKPDSGTSTVNLKPWEKKALAMGFENAITSGPILGFPTYRFYLCIAFQ